MDDAGPLKINIRPQVTILSVLKHLNYRPWFAIAEFVDNSMESYRRHVDSINEVEGDLPQIVVPVAMLVPDASFEVCARHRDVACQELSSQLAPVADNPANCAV